MPISAAKGTRKDSEGDAASLEVSGLTKFYRRNLSFSDALAAGLFSRGQPAASGSPADGVSALQDVSFSVARGEAFGIIGRNGAGKSTLLQILAGTLQPTSGTCAIRGRVTALLELGSGFNPEFTGRENIYLSGAILGFSRAEMERRFDAIAAFADIGEFIERPVKTYSTGMMMRVAFAVAISVEPDVLIIDEALSVGDIVFQQKCSRRLRELAQAGVTLLVVTHDLAFVLSMCQRAIWLDSGRVRYLGDAGACVRAYVAAMSALAGNAEAPAATLDGMGRRTLPTVPELDLTGKERLGGGDVRVARAWLLQGDGAAGGTFGVGDWAEAVFLITASRDVRAVSGGCELRNRHGQVVFASGLRVVRRLIESIPAGESVVVSIRFQLELQPGQYTLDLGCGASSEGDKAWDRVLNAAVLDVSSTPEQEVVHGMVRLPHEVVVSRPA